VLDDQPELRQRLKLRAAVRTANAEGVRVAVEDLIEVDDYVEYREAWDYARRVEQASDAIVSLVDAGAAGAAIDIAREAFDLLTDAYASVDDSSGAVGGARHSLFAAHLRACQVARPDPEGLAEYLMDVFLEDQYGFEPELDDYSPLLDEAGQAVVRRRMSEFSKQNPGSWRAQHLMELITKAEAGNLG
ncbi:MAG: DUF6880 family protein, partial [Trebonia sp.]